MAARKSLSLPVMKKIFNVPFKEHGGVRHGYAGNETNEVITVLDQMLVLTENVVKNATSPTRDSFKFVMHGVVNCRTSRFVGFDGVDHLILFFG